AVAVLAPLAAAAVAGAGSGRCVAGGAGQVERRTAGTSPTAALFAPLAAAAVAVAELVTVTAAFVLPPAAAAGAFCAAAAFVLLTAAADGVFSVTAEVGASVDAGNDGGFAATSAA
ncbi:unnamed protein product, partial [Ectocarpus fasciculatus]